MKKWVLALILILLISSTYSQNTITPNPETGKGVIVGTISDKSTKTPIDYAQLAVYKQIDSTLVYGSISDAQGKFRIGNVLYDDYYITAQFIGYKTSVISDIRISKENQNIELNDMVLEMNLTELDEVIITANANQMNIKVDKKVLNVDKNISAKGGTAIDALKISPLVTINQDNEVLLRGSKAFKVLINGKPTVLSSNDALQQMPAGKIDKIELITNPSAKYDAEGSAGIINIITKKGFGTGYSALANASAGIGGKYNADLNLNYTAEKLTLTLGGKWKNSMNYYNMDELIEVVKDGDPRKTDADFYRLITFKNLGGNLSVDYNLNSKNSVSYAADAGFAHQYIGANFKYDESIQNQLEHTYIYEDIHSKNLADYFTNNLSFTHNFSDQSSCTNMIFYSHINYLLGNNQDRYNTSSDFNWEQIRPYYTLRSENENFSTEWRAATDYVQTFNNGAKLEAGGQYHQYHRYQDLMARSFNYDSEIWSIDPVFTNVFDFSEQTYSTYANYSGESKDINYSIGLRFEYNNRLIESFTLKEQYTYSKLNYFPTLSVSKTLDEFNTLSFNYSRRINRPDEYFLNPFPDVSNEFQVAHGNPNLRPYLVDSYELSWQKIFSIGMFSSQSYMRKSKDAFTQVIGSNENGIMVLTFDNISDDIEFGIENMLNIQAAKWWNLNASLNVMGQNSKGVMNDEKFNRSALTFNSRIINSVKIGRNTKMELMAFYFHDQIGNAIGDVKRFYWIDAAINHNFLNDRLSVGIQAKDIFNSNKLKFDIKGADYRFLVHRKPEYPVVLFNISWKINNFKASKSVKTKLKMG